MFSLLYDSKMLLESGWGTLTLGKHDFWRPSHCMMTFSLHTFHIVYWKCLPVNIYSDGTHSCRRGESSLDHLVIFFFFLYKKWPRSADLQGFVQTHAVVWSGLPPVPWLSVQCSFNFHGKTERTEKYQNCWLRQLSFLVGNVVYKWGTGSNPVWFGMILIDKYCHEIWF